MADDVTTGICDWCGQVADASESECNSLSCTYAQCPGGLYHQDCLERYLRTSKLEKNRKTGFKCPRGCGKGTKFDSPCPGRIDKSHPIHPRNQELKQKRQAAASTAPPKPAAPATPPPTVAANGKAAAKGKEDGKPPKVPAATTSTSKSSASLPVTQQKQAPPAPPNPAKEREKLAELKAAARREMGLAGPGQSKEPAPQPAKAASALDAWARKGTLQQEVAAPTPQPVTLAQHPQLQQLLQQAASKKAKSTATTGATSMASALAGQQQQQPQQQTAAALVQQTAASTAAVTATTQQTAKAAAPTPTPAPPVRPAPPQAPPPPPPPPPEPPEAPSSTGAGTSDAGDDSGKPVGMEYLEEEDGEQKLTKAQRKNLKRAEKKKKGEKGTAAAAPEVPQPQPSPAATASASTSHLDSPFQQGSGERDAASQGAASPANGPCESDNASTADSGEDAERARDAGREQDREREAEASSLAQAEAAEREVVMEELLLTCLVSRKVQSCILQLLRLGFTAWQAVWAIQCHGGNLHRAVAWLLEHWDASPEEAAGSILQMQLGAACPEVDVSEELKQLEDFQSLVGLPRNVMQQMVTDSCGDVQAAITNVMGQMPLQQQQLLLHQASMMGLRFGGSGGGAGAGSLGLDTRRASQISMIDLQSAPSEGFYSTHSEFHSRVASMASGDLNSMLQELSVQDRSATASNDDPNLVSLLLQGSGLQAGRPRNGFTGPPPGMGAPAAPVGAGTSRLTAWMAQEGNQEGGAATASAAARAEDDSVVPPGWHPHGSFLGAPGMPKLGQGQAQANTNGPRYGWDAAGLLQGARGGQGEQGGLFGAAEAGDAAGLQADDSDFKALMLMCR